MFLWLLRLPWHLEALPWPLEVVVLAVLVVLVVLVVPVAVRFPQIRGESSSKCRASSNYKYRTVRSLRLRTSF